MKRTTSRKYRKLFVVGKYTFLFCVLLLLAGVVVVFYKKWAQPLFVSPVPAKIKAQSVPFGIHADEIDRQLRKKSIAYDQIISAEGNNFIITLADNKEVIFSGNKDIFLQVSSLQLVLSRLTIEGKRFKRLDFRFDKPIIVVE